MVSPQAKRAAVETLMTERSLGVTRACGAGGDFALAVSLSKSASGLQPVAIAYRGDCRGQASLREEIRQAFEDYQLWRMGGLTL
jgi:hypothetical protein